MSRREPVQSPDPTHGDDFADEHDSVVVDENHTDRRGVRATVRQAVGGPDSSTSGKTPAPPTEPDSEDDDRDPAKPDDAR